MNLRTTFLVSAFFGFLAACDGASSDPGVSHPIIVHGAQLRDGPLPGSRTSSEAGVDEGARIAKAIISSINALGTGSGL